MYARKTLTAVLGVASFFAAPALFASSLHLAAPVRAAFSHTKTVKFDVRNSSAMAVELRTGDTVQTVAAGRTVSFNLPLGTRVTANKACGNYAEGAVVAEAQTPLSGSTVVLH